MSSVRRTGSVEVSSNELGTLWRMRKHGSAARCALVAWPFEWEVRVVVDGNVLYTSRCEHAKDVFSLAEEWKARLSAEGWTAVVPQVRLKATERDTSADGSGT